MTAETNIISIKPGYVLKATLGFIVVLLLLHAAALVLHHGMDSPYAKGFVPLVHLDFEKNLPTTFAFLLLLFAAALASLTTRNEARAGRSGRVWLFIAAAFAFVAFDEILGFHEAFGEFLHQRVDGLPFFTWIVPYGLAAGLVGLILLPWFFRLERSTRIGLGLSVLVFVSGALGMELLASGYYEQRFDEPGAIERTFFGDILSSIEETMELLGVALFNFTLLQRLGPLTIHTGTIPATA